MKYYAALLLIFPVLLSANVKPNAPFEGHYRCKGYDFTTKRNYIQEGDIVKTGDTYSFTRKDPKEGIFYATGIANNDSLSFVFWHEKDKDEIGAATYVTQLNGDLKGKWTMKNSQIVAEDHCVRIK
jgi:hypothetical protein